MPKSLPWKILTQTRDDYDPIRIKKLQLLYQGGYDIIKSSSLFMPKWRMETPDAYHDRLAHSTYENNFQEIVNDISSSLFQKALQILPATDAEDVGTPGDDPETPEIYQEFLDNADQQNHTIDDILQCLQNRAAVTKQAYLGIDFTNNKPYVYEIDNLSVLDYECDSFGDYLWITLRKDERSRKTVISVRDKITTSIKVWKRNLNEDGSLQNVIWELYQITYEPNNPPDGDKPIPMVEEGKVDFKHIPIVCYDLPTELYTGGLIGQLCESLFVRTSSYYHALSRGMYGILVYEQGESDRDDDVHSDVEDNENRGSSTVQDYRSKMNAVTGPKDKVYWAEMRGSAFGVVQKQLEQDKNELYRIVNQMGSQYGVAHGASKAPATAMSIDTRNKEIIISAYANLIKKIAIRILSIISATLDESIVWQTKGMDNYHEVDTTSLMLKITTLPIIRANILSPTSYKQTLMDVAAELHPFVNPGTLGKIQQEISDAVDTLDMSSIDAPQIDGTPKPAPKESTKNYNTKSNSTSISEDPQVGESGHMAGADGMHLQTGQHIDSSVIFNQLAEDYNEKDIQWVLQIPWKGPMEVPLSSIDFSNMSNWQASEETDKVDDFADKIANGGFDKPIILVNSPSNNNKAIIVDGHHRALAYLQLKQPAIAYIGEIGQDKGPWDKLHSKQVGNKQASLSSNQKDK